MFKAKAQRPEWLAQYSQVFPAVEGNNVFYGMPAEKDFHRWGAETADGFEFCSKFPRTISHDCQLVNCRDELNEFLKRLAILADAEKLGPSFLQMPPGFSASAFPHLEDFLRSLPRDFPFAVEVRHRDYFDESENERRLDDLLVELKIDRCLFDSRALFSRPPEDETEIAAQKKKARLSNKQRSIFSSVSRSSRRRSFSDPSK